MPRRNRQSFQYEKPPVFQYQTFERDTRGALAYHQNPLFPGEQILFSDRFTNSVPQPEASSVLQDPEPEQDSTILERKATDEGKMRIHVGPYGSLTLGPGYVSSNEPPSPTPSKAAMAPSMSSVTEEGDDDIPSVASGMLQSPKSLERRLRGSLDTKSILDLSEVGEIDLASDMTPKQEVPEPITEEEEPIEEEPAQEEPTEQDFEVIKEDNDIPPPAPDPPSVKDQDDAEAGPNVLILDNDEVESPNFTPADDADALIPEVDRVTDDATEHIEETKAEESESTEPADPEKSEGEVLPTEEIPSTQSTDEPDERQLDQVDTDVNGEKDDDGKEVDVDETSLVVDASPTENDAEPDEAVLVDEIVAEELVADEETKGEEIVAVDEPVVVVEAEDEALIEEISVELETDDAPVEVEILIEDGPAESGAIEPVTDDVPEEEVAIGETPAEPNADDTAAEPEAEEPGEEVLVSEDDLAAKEVDVEPLTEPISEEAAAAETSNDAAALKESTTSEEDPGEPVMEAEIATEDGTSTEIAPPGAFPDDAVLAAAPLDADGTPTETLANGDDDGIVEEDVSKPAVVAEPIFVAEVEAAVEEPVAEEADDAEQNLQAEEEEEHVVPEPEQEAEDEAVVPASDPELEIPAEEPLSERLGANEPATEDSSRDIESETLTKDHSGNHRANLVAAAAAGAAAAVVAHEAKKHKDRKHWEREAISPNTSMLKDGKPMLERGKEEYKPFVSAFARQLDKAKEERDKRHATPEYQEKLRRRHERREARGAAEAEERRKERKSMQKDHEIRLAYEAGLQKKKEELKREAEEERRKGSEPRHRDETKRMTRAKNHPDHPNRGNSSRRSSDGTETIRPALLKRIATGESDTGGPLLMLNMAKAGGYEPQEIPRSAPISPPRSMKSPVLIRTSTDYDSASASGTDADGHRRHRHRRRHHSRHGTREESIETTSQTAGDGNKVVMSEKLIRRITSNGSGSEEPPVRKLLRRLTDAINK